MRVHPVEESPGKRQWLAQVMTLSFDPGSTSRQRLELPDRFVGEVQRVHRHADAGEHLGIQPLTAAQVSYPPARSARHLGDEAVAKLHMRYVEPGGAPSAMPLVPETLLG